MKYSTSRVIPILFAITFLRLSPASAQQYWLTGLGSEQVFSAETTGDISACTLDTDKVLIAYKDSSNLARAVVAAVSGTAVSFGTPVTVNAAYTDTVSACRLSADSVLIAYADGGSGSYGTARIAHVAGSEITLDPPSVFSAQYTYYPETVALDASRALIVYRDGGNADRPTAVVGDVSGGGALLRDVDRPQQHTA